MNFVTARHNMVASQIQPNNVTDSFVIRAMAAVPREEFVPKAMRGIAYMDEDLDLGAGRYLLEPMVLARLLQAAAIEPEHVVLDIGCATGYSTAVLARMASTVLAVECDPALAGAATEALIRAGIDNAAVVTGPLEQGYPAQAPYNVIIFEGAVTAVPEPVRNQLADGGRLVVIIEDGGIGRGTLITRTGNVFGTRVLFEANAPRLPGFAQAPVFVF
ncbi:MAG: protein-L-isoaspartate O-methyltransferase [Alphaproteobacteria bacterium]|nr:protein-L-isoaspartate O-methyltransferase [Alphaproteobacteria bacterium]